MRELQISRGKNVLTLRNLAWAYSINIIKQGSKVYKFHFNKVHFVMHWQSDSKESFSFVTSRAHGSNIKTDINTPLIFNQLLEDISLLHFNAPSFVFLFCLSLRLSYYFFPYFPYWLALLLRLRLSNIQPNWEKRKEKTERQTEKKHKGGSIKMQQRNIFPHPQIWVV